MAQPFKNVGVIILAAGKGTRMKSSLPKVLHQLAGKTIIEHVIDRIEGAIGNQETCLVLGGDVEAFSPLIAKYQHLNICIQRDQKGTADAVAAASPAFSRLTPPPFASCELTRGKPFASEYVLICAGDVPAMPAETLHAFVEQSLKRDSHLAVLGMVVPNPHGYGRLVIENQHELAGIIEEKDASPEIKKITLCNSGVVFAKIDVLASLLKDVHPHNAQGEYYLTDIFAIARSRKIAAFVYTTHDAVSFAGINDRAQLAAIEKSVVEKKIEKLMQEGVTFKAPHTSYVEVGVVIAADTIIGPGANLCGETVIESRCNIGAHVTIENAKIGEASEIGDGCVVKNTLVEKNSKLAPHSQCGK